MKQKPRTWEDRFHLCCGQITQALCLIDDTSKAIRRELRKQQPKRKKK